MKVNKIVKLENGTEVIAVPQEGEECEGCFFYNNECKAAYIPNIICWDSENNELIFKLKK